jgi:hypothetical protein
MSETIDMGGYRINARPSLPETCPKPNKNRLWIAGGLILTVLLIFSTTKTKATSEIPSKAISEPIRPTVVESPKPVVVEKTNKSMIAVGKAVNIEGNGNEVRIGDNVNVTINVSIVVPILTLKKAETTEIVQVEAEQPVESEHCRKLREEHERRLAAWKKTLGVK